MKKIILLTAFVTMTLSQSFSQILYTDYSPDEYGTCLPDGHIDSNYVDVNQDGQDDFIIICNSYFFYEHQMCCWNYRNRILGIDPQNGLAINDTVSSSNCGRLFLDSGQCVVGASLMYENNALFSQEGPEYPYCGPPSTVTEYYPFRVILNSNIHYGWFRILTTAYSAITIYDAAVNLIPDSNICCGQTIGITELNHNNSINLFPNPFREQTILQAANQLKNASLTISNVIGMRIKEIKNISGQTLTLQRDNLTSGVYFIQLMEDDKVIGKGKLVITD